MSSTRGLITGAIAETCGGELTVSYMHRGFVISQGDGGPRGQGHAGRMVPGADGLLSLVRLHVMVPARTPGGHHDLPRDADLRRGNPHRAALGRKAVASGRGLLLRARLVRCGVNAPHRTACLRVCRLPARCWGRRGRRHGCRPRPSLAHGGLRLRQRVGGHTRHVRRSRSAAVLPSWS